MVAVNSSAQSPVQLAVGLVVASVFAVGAALWLGSDSSPRADVAVPTPAPVEADPSATTLRSADDALVAAAPAERTDARTSEVEAGPVAVLVQGEIEVRPGESLPVSWSLETQPLSDEDSAT